MVLKGEDYLGVVGASDLIEGQEGAHWFGALRNVQVAEVMQAQAPTIDERTDVRTALSLMMKKGMTALPLTREGKVSGIVTETDMLRVMEWLVDKALGMGSIKARAEAALANPLVQNLAKALGDAGI